MTPALKKSLPRVTLVVPGCLKAGREQGRHVSQFPNFSETGVCVCVCVCVCGKEGPEDREVALVRKEGERRGSTLSLSEPQGTMPGRGQGQSVSRPLTL